MKRICPNPMRWNDVFKRLNTYAKRHPCVPPSPPVPLVLGGWAYSNDVEKLRRWEETVAWATSNGCSDLVRVPDEDFYYVDEPTSYTVGPLGDPMYRPWDFEKKNRPPSMELAAHLETLKSRWPDIVGQELARVIARSRLRVPRHVDYWSKLMKLLGHRGVLGRDCRSWSQSVECSPTSVHQSIVLSLRTKSIM
jgi:hypothetical protein